MTCLRERADGTIETLGRPDAPGLDGPLARCVAALAGCEERWVEPLVERARAGTPSALALTPDDGEAGRVLVWARADGLYALYAAQPDPDRLAERAAAAERAAGVAHEVANSLTAISGWTKMAASTAPLPERTSQALEVVQRSAKQALGLARGLLRTMRDTGQSTVFPTVPESTDAAEVVAEVLETLRPEIEAQGVALDVELPAGVRGTAPPSALRSIVSNLVRNALEAFDGGGTIAVSLAIEGDRFVLTVTDDGPGMHRHTLERAFERYFTTKDAGTGLGLAMIRDTVDELGGRIEVSSTRGAGTTFEIWLPVAGASKLSLRPPKFVSSTSNSGVRTRPPLAARKVLVVDDDDAIRSMIRTALELQGLTVRAAGDRESALALASIERFDVVLVDLTLDDERGDELLAELRGLDRFERAVLMTGSAEADLAPQGAPDAVLRKPFELDELHRLVDLMAPPALVAEG